MRRQESPRIVSIDNPISKAGIMQINVRDPIPQMTEVVVEEIIKGMATVDALINFRDWLMDRDDQLFQSRARALAIAIEVIRESTSPEDSEALVGEIKRRLRTEGQAS